MKKLLIASIVGGLILFMWQFLSWNLLNIHLPNLSYTPNQEKILNVLNENLEEGSYFLPTIAPDATPEAQQELIDNMIGKPWATVTYHNAFQMNMGSNMFRGFLIDFIAVLFLAWILGKFREQSMRNAIQTSLFVGLIGYLSINYLDSIWFDSNSIPYLIDAVVSWGVVGLWLGFWLPRN